MVQDEEKMWAVVGVALPLIGYLVLMFAKKGGAYARHYAKQGVVLFFVWLAVLLAGIILSLLPIIGGVLEGVLHVLWVILWVVGIVYAVSGKKQLLPVVGEYAKKF